MDKPLRIAVVGAGRMGCRHLQNVRVLALTLVGLCDTRPDALRSAASECGVSNELLFTSSAALLQKRLADAVIIATTAPSHCDLVCMAAESGVKFILCEKPMAVSLEQCDRMIQICRQHGVNLAVNHQMRFMEQYTEPKRIVNSPEFGGLSSVTVLAGNFGLAMNGTHYFEMFRFMADEPPVEATAWFSSDKLTNPRGPQFEDRAGSVRMVTARGTRFYLDASCNQGHGIQVVYAGPYGQLIVDELAGTMRATVRETAHRHLPTTRYGMPCLESTSKIVPADSIAPSRAVLRTLLEKSDYPTGEDGRASVAALVAAYLSDERGHVAVPINSALPHDHVFPWA